MEKLLIICEKPSAMRNFAAALGGRQGSFEGDTYAICNLYGHIMELGTPAQVAKKDYKSIVGDFKDVAGIPWNPEYFDFYSKALKSGSGDFDGYKQSYSTIQTFLNAGYIPVIASDIDVWGEGDLLVQEVLDSLNYTGKRYREYHVSEMPKDVIKALKNKKEVTNKDPEYMVGFTRQCCDFLTQQYTRVATMGIQDEGYQLPGVVPFGRLQSVIIKLVGDQEKAIKNYKPSSVWESRYKLENLTLTSDDESLPKFATKEEWEARGLPAQAKVKKVREVPGTTKPPKPLDLTSLSAILSKQGIPIKRTLELAQKLYENGDGSGLNYLSYPRTEENHITTEQFSEILPLVDNYIKLLELPAAAFSHRQPRMDTHVKDSGGHGALRPGAVPKSLADLDAQFGKGAGLLYKTVTERFLLMFLEDTEWVRHEYETVDVTPIFKGSLKVITKQGVIDSDAEPDDTQVTSLPNLSNMAELYPHEVKSVKPANPTSAWLLGQLKKEGVGTQSTQSRTVGELTGATERHPLRDGKVLSLSVIGQIGYIAAEGTLIGSIEGTKFMQECILAVKKGVFTPAKAIAKFSEAIERDIQVLRNKNYNLDELNLPKRAKREAATGLWRGTEVVFNRQYGSHRFTDEEVDKLLAGENITIEIDTKNGRMKVAGQLDNMEYQGRPYVGFNGEFIREGYVDGVWNGRQISFKKSYGDYQFNTVEVQKLLDGETISIETSKGTLTGKLEDQEYNGNPFVGFKPHFPKREGYIYGEFQGKEISFRDNFMQHKYTQEEIDTLLAGKKIAFKGVTKQGKERMVGGGLGKKTYKGRTFIDFIPEFDNKEGGFGG